MKDLFGNDNAIEYERYIKSASWRRRAARVKLERGEKCERCGGTTNLQVHHLTYRNIGNEPNKDLLVLCRQCHSLADEIRIAESRWKIYQNRKEAYKNKIRELARKPIGYLGIFTECVFEEEELNEKFENMLASKGDDDPTGHKRWAHYSYLRDLFNSIPPERQTKSQEQLPAKRPEYNCFACGSDQWRFAANVWYCPVCHPSADDLAQRR